MCFNKFRLIPVTHILYLYNYILIFIVIKVRIKKAERML